MARLVSLQRSPTFVPPMAARLVQTLPEGDQWLYEVKFDGYRALLLKAGRQVQLRSRRDNDLTREYPQLQAAGARIHAGSAVLDGEIVALGADGRPSFQALQNRGGRTGHTIVFYAFDVLNLDGEDLMGQPLEARRARLPALLDGSGLLLSEELRGSAQDVIAAVQGLELEGIIAKKRNSQYVSGDRHHAWVKLKLDCQQEFVIGGYRPGPHGVDTLLVGVYDGDALHFAGKVRAGFTPPLRRKVAAVLTPLHTAPCPFVDLPSPTPLRWGGGVTAAQMHEMQWVRPMAVAQIRFVEWTDDEHLRHAAFVGLRTDKAAGEVHRELHRRR